MNILQCTKDKFNMVGLGVANIHEITKNEMFAIVRADESKGTGYRGLIFEKWDCMAGDDWGKNIEGTDVFMTMRDCNITGIEDIFYENHLMSGVDVYRLMIFNKDADHTIYVTDGKKQILYNARNGIIAQDDKHNKTREFIEQQLLKEFADGSKVTYSGNTVKTENFVGKYIDINDKYRAVEFLAFSHKILPREVMGKNGSGYYGMIIDKTNNKVVGGRVYEEIEKLDRLTFNIGRGLWLLSYTKRNYGLRDPRKQYRLVDMERGIVLLEDVNIKVADGYYMEVIRNIRSNQESISLVCFNPKKRVLETVVNERKNVWTNYHNLVSKNTDRTMFIRKKTKGTGLYGEGKFECVARVGLKDSEEEYIRRGKTVEDLLNEKHDVTICDDSIVKLF